MVLETSAQLIDPITDENRRLAAVISRKHSGLILSLVNQAPRKASELSRLVGVSVATAQRNLREMESVGLLRATWVAGPTRPVEMFHLARNQITLSINLASDHNVMEQEARLLKLRLKKDAQMIFDADIGRSRVKEIMLVGSGPRPLLQTRLVLNSVEGKFVFQLAGFQEEPRSVLEMIDRADLESSDLPQIMSFVDRLEELGNPSPLEKFQGRLENGAET